MLELRQLGVETEFDKRVVSEIPTPNGVALQPTKLRCSSTGVSLTAFFSSVLSHPAVLRTIASVQPDGAEAKGYAVCNRVIDDGERRMVSRFATSMRRSSNK